MSDETDNGTMEDRCHKESGGARAPTAVRSGAMTPAENVLAWLGSAGAPVRLCTTLDCVEVEGDSDDGERTVRVYVAESSAHTRDVDGSFRPVDQDWTVRGEPGVRYFARWLVDGGRIESPHLERRGE